MKDSILRIAELQSELAREFRKLAERLDSASAPKDMPLIHEEELPDEKADECETHYYDEAENRLETFLKTRGIEVVSYNQRYSTPVAWKNIASFIAGNFENVKDFLQLLKRYQSNQRRFTMNLKNHQQERISDITNLANQAYRCGLIPEMRYNKSPRYQLICAPPDAPEAINFFNGEWVEIYVYFSTLDIFGELPEEHRPSITSGVQAYLPNGDVLELDLCVLISDNRLVWVETKSGNDYQPMLSRYKKYSQHLKVDKRDALLVNPNFFIGDVNAQSQGSLAGMTPYTLQEFEDYMRQIVKEIQQDSESGIGDRETVDA